MRKTVGVFARRYHKHPARPFGSQTQFFETLSREGRDLDIDFNFFSVDTWQKNETVIDTLFFDGQQWRPKKAQIPNVIFDRFIPNRRLRPAARTFLQYLQTNNAQIMTPVALYETTANKSKFGHFLKKHDLPRIKAFSFKKMTEERLQALLAKNGTVYLKPHFGLQGSGIVVIEKLKWYQGWQRVAIHSITKGTVTVKSKQLLPALKAYQNFNRYIVQADANAYRFEDSPVCLRILVQNRGGKRYGVTGKLARIGAKKAHLAVPGPERRALPLDEMADYYRKVYKKDIVAETARIDEICLRCCDKLHQEFGSFLELGFDIMLTRDQGPIILEANSQPGRQLFKAVADAYPKGSIAERQHRAIQKESISRPVLYISSFFS